MPRSKTPDWELRLGRVLAWLATDLRALAAIPLLLIAIYWAAGPDRMLLVAALLPAFVAIGHVAMERRARGNGQRDPATGIESRQAAERWLERQLIRADATDRSFAVMAIALDDADSIADRVGPGMRDAILAEMSARFAALIRGEDLLASGQPGVFLVCLADIRAPETDNLLQLANRLKTTLEQPFQRGSVRLFCGVSIGISRAR